MRLPCAGSEILYELLRGLETIAVAQSTDAKQKARLQRFGIGKTILFGAAMRWEWLMMRNVTFSFSGLEIRKLISANSPDATG